jgi:1-acyl-sn-glycerol-3-phosphate acyltransferase
VRALSRALFAFCGIPLAVEGLSNLAAAKPAVIVANHASYVDAFVLAAVLPPGVRFAAKREFARTPLIGWVLRRLGAFLVERVDAAGGIDDTRRIGEAVRSGETVVFFPEGTFSRVPGLAKFRLGAFVVAAAAGMTIVPVVLRGTRSVLRESRWLPVRYPVSVGIEPPVVPDGTDWSAAVRLRDRVRQRILRRCGEPDLARAADVAAR